MQKCPPLTSLAWIPGLSSHLLIFPEAFGPALGPYGPGRELVDVHWENTLECGICTEKHSSFTLVNFETEPLTYGHTRTGLNIKTDLCLLITDPDLSSFPVGFLMGDASQSINSKGDAPKQSSNRLGCMLGSTQNKYHQLLPFIWKHKCLGGSL